MLLSFYCISDVSLLDYKCSVALPHGVVVFPNHTHLLFYIIFTRILLPNIH